MRFNLGDLVNEVQSAFVADRQILDGPFILDEVLQWCRRKKKHALIFKVDFEKAFDSGRVKTAASKLGVFPYDSSHFIGVRKLGKYVQEAAWKEVVDKVLISGRTEFDKDVSGEFVPCWTSIDSRSKGVNKVGFSKLNASSLDNSFRRKARSGIEEMQLNSLAEISRMTTLVPCEDRYVWTLESDGVFLVASIRKEIDGNRFQDVSLPTRWVKSVPIKVNIIAWKVKSNALPTRFNISRRGMDIDSIVCPICNAGVESTNHIFFQCVVVRQIMRRYLLGEFDYRM
ncbi:RNA-directed DNA polymerase, eukaryota [Tanacetum coccineum]